MRAGMFSFVVIAMLLGGAPDVAVAQTIVSCVDLPLVRDLADPPPLFCQVVDDNNPVGLTVGEDPDRVTEPRFNVGVPESIRRTLMLAPRIAHWFSFVFP